MKKRLLFIMTALIALLLIVTFVIGCSNADDQDHNGDNPSQGVETPDGSDEEKTIDADVVLFIGQSNMAGRGDSSAATAVEEGHAFEFRAISDPTRLYPLQEPFGAAENNTESGVSENSKTGSLVSAFCESYYNTTQTPIVAVSCSKGGEAISFFDTDGAAYKDACERVQLAQAFLKNGAEWGNSTVKLRNTYVVWLQGESDGDAGTSQTEYTEILDDIVNGFKNDIGAQQFFIIPIGGYNEADGSLKAKYNAIRDAQILYCENNEDATVISRQLYDVYSCGYMKDKYHYTQEGYEIVGTDAGMNMGQFVLTGNKPECLPYFAQEERIRENGAWQEIDGKVVIPAAAALEQSRYANYSTNDDNYSWQKYAGDLEGIIQAPSKGDGKQWSLASAFASAPQVHYTFNVNTTGKYYLYLLTSYPDTGSNSVYASLDNEDSLIECSTQSYEPGLWINNASWYFDVDVPGEHTITVYAREDGVILNQIVLSTNPAEHFTQMQEEPVSERNPYVIEGAFAEVGGTVKIDLASALDNSNAAQRFDGSANNSDQTFTWERSAGLDGVQVYPDAGVQWSTNNISPKLSYKVDFSTPGEYYVMLYSSFTDGNSDSVFISVDDGPIVTCLSYVATGVGKWMADDGWKINIPYAGMHTINIFAREDGAVLHKLYLTRQPVLDPYSPVSPRASLQDEETYSTAGGGALIPANAAVGSFTLDFDKTGDYLVYIDANASQGAVASLQISGNETLTYEFQSDFSGWNKAFKFTVGTAGKQTVSLNVSGNIAIRRVNIVRAEAKENAGVQTLVFGDSYTSKTAWKHFDEQTASIGGVTIGIGGTKVNTWSKYAEDLLIYDPENIVLHIGVNDIDGGTSGTDCGNSIVALVKDLQNLFPNTKIFYVSICDNEKFPDKWGEYAISNEIVESYAEQTDNVFYIDFASVMKIEGPKMENMGFRDELHLNNTAYVLFSQIICDAVLAENVQA